MPGGRGVLAALSFGWRRRRLSWRRVFGGTGGLLLGRCNRAFLHEVTRGRSRLTGYGGFFVTPLGRADLPIVVIGFQALVDHARQAAFQAAPCIGPRVTGIQSPAIVRSSRAVEADLCDGDAVQCLVELAIARSGHADATGCGAGPPRDRGHPAKRCERRFALEPRDIGGFPDDLGCRQWPAAGHSKQGGGKRVDPLADALVQRIDRRREPVDVVQLVVPHRTRSCIGGRTAATACRKPARR